MVFGQFFRFEIPGTPYVVYLLSGILLITYFAQAVQASGAAIVNNAGILTKVFVPAEVFSFSTVASATVNFLISLLPMAIIQLITGVGIPWTVFLVPIPIIAMFALTAGIGLLIAAAAVFFYDVLDLTAVMIQLVSYMTPTFYPISIVPEWALPIIYLNPLFSYLEVFRGFMYQGQFAPAWNFAYMFISAIVSLLIGVYVFSRSWRNLIAVL
jgi:ABC-type polysaccharide/polyol phosphate export permease